MAVDPMLLRQVMSQFATGITVVTTCNHKEIHGLTVNAFCSVSLAPPLVLVCIDKKASSHDLIANSGNFAVNILNQAQEPIARKFSTNFLQSEERFADIEYRREATGAPVLAEAVGWLDCKLVADYPGGDHTIFLGEVVASGHRTDMPPLLFFRSRYHQSNGELL
jgi:flavin reductase (DIM6/NTAB) family NADH-FMN oxidoreductase RutF